MTSRHLSNGWNPNVCDETNKWSLYQTQNMIKNTTILGFVKDNIWGTLHNNPQMQCNQIMKLIFYTWAIVLSKNPVLLRAWMIDVSNSKHDIDKEHNNTWIYRAFSHNPKRHSRQRTGRPWWCSKHCEVIRQYSNVKSTPTRRPWRHVNYINRSHVIYDVESPDQRLQPKCQWLTRKWLMHQTQKIWLRAR